ncbi:Bud13 [Corchorus olitorius]|uniref:Bud13 n=1 Tax=Corchorus olitorius TaxID=93759 RepID=A0A1R3JW44_9ROSI|nr:Bud13 [Corchorus olitorius]
MDLNSDISPPRRQRARNDTPSPEPGLRHSNSQREVEDLSPPRKLRSPSSKSDLSPPRKSRTRHDTPPAREDYDLSPPRRKASPPRKSRTRHDTPPARENADLSPPRRKASPPRKTRTRHDTPPAREDADLSPPRRKAAQTGSLDNRVKAEREGTDLSPPRKRRVRNDTPSPEPVMNRADTDLSPPRKRSARNDTGSPERSAKPLRKDTDLSPPRQRLRRHRTPSPEPDMSPPRRSRPQTSEDVHVPDLSPPRKSMKESTGPAAMKERRKTGLISGREMGEEISKTKKDDWLKFKEMDPSISGRGAEPVFRDKAKGERISKEEYLKSKQKVEDKPKEKVLEWGKGLAQKREAEAKLQELEREKVKPFARTRDDPELDNMLKERLRFGDPMAHLVKKKIPEPVLRDLGDAEKMKESGFMIPQDIPAHSWITRKLDAAPNRYNIRPGRHWDGVDRSTGFEKKMFTKLNEKRATEQEAYLWSVSDM